MLSTFEHYVAMVIEFLVFWACVLSPVVAFWQVLAWAGLGASYQADPVPRKKPRPGF